MFTLSLVMLQKGMQTGFTSPGQTHILVLIFLLKQLTFSKPAWCYNKSCYPGVDKLTN